MKIFFKRWMCVVITLCSVTTHAYSLDVSSTPALMPMPAKIQMLEGVTTLKSTLSVYIPKDQLELLQPLVTNSLFAEQFKKINWVEKSKAELQIGVEKIVSPLPYLGMNEEYQLSISNNVIILNSTSQFGTLRGLASLSQLLFNSEKALQLANVNISDQPTYPWRGLLFDSVRHFLPIEDVKRTLRGLASAKFNVFHWHLTDDQGWRIELKSYPKLHQKASDGLYYTQIEIKEVVEYAAMLGIRVVPEFDVPGHASTIVLAYLELGSGTKLNKIERKWGVFKPLLDPSNPKVYEFIDEVVAELVDLFPDDYLHIGGDEVDDTDWRTNSKIQAYMRDNNLVDSDALHADFNQQVAQILAKYNKKMIGWDEVLHPSLPKDTLVQSWRGHHSLTAITEAGHDALLSSGFYIDQPQWSSYHYRNHPVTPLTPEVTAKVIFGNVKFSLARLKGSAIKGNVTVFEDKQNRIQAIVNIAAKGAFLTSQVSKLASNYQVHIDTWMGPTILTFNVAQLSKIPAFIGNTPYDFTANITDKISLNQLNQQLVKQQQRVKLGRVLGGEATIWSELITSDKLDTRIWPRLYAIGERFWSPASLTDEQDMYTRLEVMDRYAHEKVGLLHQQQLINRLKKIPTSLTHDFNVLIAFSQLIEPAHYYTLHHLAFLRDEYHQQAPLNKLLDYLPVESLTLKRFDYNVDAYLQQCEAAKLESLQTQLSAWQQLLDNNQDTFLAIDEWKEIYLAIRDAFHQKDIIKPQRIRNFNGTVTQVIASMNHFNKAQLHCQQ